VQADLPGQRGPQVSFEKSNLPAAAEVEVHVDPMARPVVARHEASIGEGKVKMYTAQGRIPPAGAPNHAAKDYMPIPVRIR
jgi:hypothetical protein